MEDGDDDAAPGSEEEAPARLGPAPQDTGYAFRQLARSPGFTAVELYLRDGRTSRGPKPTGGALRALLLLQPEPRGSWRTSERSGGS